jgi:subtilisin family serine protease
MPLGGFAVYHTYWIFGAARGGDDRPAKGAASDGCAGNRCFASTLIHWQSGLRSCTNNVKVGIIDTSFDIKSDEAGNASTDTMRLLQALDWLDALDVRYINMSFSGPRDPLFEKAIARMTAKGVIFIAAAGNQGPTARNAENYRHANRGPYVDLSAPGVEIMTALPDNRQGFRTGTSFAAPFVTAIIATRSDLVATKLSKEELLGRLNLQDLGPPGRAPIYGQGLARAPRTCSDSGGTIAERDAAPPSPQRSMGAATASTSISW